MTSIPSAREMATSLRLCVYKLYESGILQQESLSVIGEVYSKLQKFRGKRVWSYSVGRGTPIRFVKTTDNNNEMIIPSICVEHISVNEKRNPLPYVKWNIALEIRFEKGNKLCARWHFDFANKEQLGPVTHLQYGGQRFDSHLDVPRWYMPLMDLVLLSEVVAANFFPERWESVRDDPNWCESVHMSQKLCLGPYLERVSKTLKTSSKTILDEVWNDRWD